jgi:hypothetical protein
MQCVTQPLRAAPAARRRSRRAPRSAPTASPRAVATPQRAGAAAAAPSSAPAPAGARSTQQQQLQRTPEWAARHAHNPCLAGNFAPVVDEVTLASLRVDGVLPPSVEGVFLRNGPNPRWEPVEGHHWFGACAARSFRAFSGGLRAHAPRHDKTRGTHAHASRALVSHAASASLPRAPPA